MFKNILAVILIVVLLLTFTFGYTSDNNITNEDNFVIDVEKTSSWTSTMLNTLNTYVNDIKTNTMSKYLEVMHYMSNVVEGFTSIEINKVKDIFNKDNIFSFFKSFISLIIAPFYILYCFSMLFLNVVIISAQLVVNLLITCIDIGRVLS